MSGVTTFCDYFPIVLPELQQDDSIVLLHMLLPIERIETMSH